MGLDMSLCANRHFYDDQEAAKNISDILPELKGMTNPFGSSVISKVEAEVGYWRKANAIHRWFVDNVQGGTDDCGTYYVSRDHLVQLKSLCKSVLNDPDNANSVLPTASGFFFGSTDYGSFYFEDLEYTIGLVDRCLELPEEWSFSYYSSW